MVNKNEIKKSLIVSTAVLCAGTMLAMSPAQTVSAAVANPVSIATVVEQAPSASIEVLVQWSTAEVYKNARYGETWGGPLTDKDAGKADRVCGTQTRWEWLNDMNFVFTAENMVTENGTTLNYQYLAPIDFAGFEAHDSYISHTDDNEPIRKYFEIQSLGFPKDEQDTIKADMQKLIGAYQKLSVYSDVGLNFLDYQEDDVTNRFTFNITRVNEAYGTIEKGFVSYMQNRATGEFYKVTYTEQEDFYDATRALTVIFSCIPTQK